ncbi:hypothetical protein ACF1GY_19455 [Streptomyces sp. NPDC014684]|uniref:hypothetical protein n=1 Tax=Streptomyces sp. NPDC014684 TaxID=3364880 RepID=UPI0036F76D31
MVTSTHEASHRIFQDRPELLAPVFDLLGVPMSAKASVSVLSADVLNRRLDRTPTWRASTTSSPRTLEPPRTRLKPDPGRPS